MKYKGYSARIRLDEENCVFYGEVLGIVDVVTFQGATVPELLKAFEESVDDYLEFCEQSGEDPDRPYSGKFVVRISSELHREASAAAEQAGTSLNSWISDCVEHCIQGPPLWSWQKRSAAMVDMLKATQAIEGCE